MAAPRRRNGVETTSNMYKPAQGCRLPGFRGARWRDEVHKAAEQGVTVYAVNGYVDHIHVVAAIPPKHAVADGVKNLKGAGSRDLNAGQGLEGQFAWQRGYGALSFGERQLPEAIRSVENQKEHHGQQTTNAWLERDAEFDEGPAPRGLAHTQVAATLRELGARYDADGGLPF
jgi:putative transposase